MATDRLRRVVAPAVILAIAAFSLAMAGCGDSKDPNASDAAVVSAISILDNAGLHDMEESINKQSTIPAGARTTVLHMQAVVLLTEWPDDLEDQSKALATLLGDFAKAMGGDKPDLKVAGEAGLKAHAGWHDFSHDVWDHLQKEAGVSGGGDGHN